MKAFVIDGAALRTATVPDPRPSPTQLLVEVRAVGVNRADLSQRRGTYGSSATTVGLELAGVVVAVGNDVRRFAPGDRVMALAPAACAELAVVDELTALPVPTGLSYEQAAAVPVAFMTEHDALVTHGGLDPTSDVLVTAAAGSVGLAALQIARYRGARRVIGTTRTLHHTDDLTRLGATQIIDQADIAKFVLQATDGVGATIAVDHVGGPVLAPCLAAMAVTGRYVSVGRLGGTTASIDLDLLARRRVTMIGVSFRTRSPKEIGAVAQRLQTDLGDAFETGALEPVIDTVFPMSAVETAHDYLIHARPFGKVVLTLG